MAAVTTADPFPWASADLRTRLVADPAGVLAGRGLTVPPDFPPAVLHEYIRVAHLLWVEGKLVPTDQFHIDPADEGLLFGRGVWESTRTVNGDPWLWPLHTDRLRQSAAVLGIDLAPDRVPSVSQVADYVRRLTTQDVVVRLNASAGPAGRPGLVWMSCAPLAHPAKQIRLKSVTNPVSKGQAYLILKTFQYATRLRLGQQVAGNGFDSALVLDAAGNVQEAAHANIFIRLPDGWVTPTADGGFLPGTVRHHVLVAAPIKVQEITVPYGLLASAREVFATNSNAGIVPVTRIDDYQYSVGPETVQLMNWIEPTPAVDRPPQYRFVQTQGVPR